MEDFEDDPVRGAPPFELRDFLARANRPWNPMQVAGRHFNALVREDAGLPALADFDELYDVADLAMQWIEHHPCPDKLLERQLRAQMMGYRAIADTVRCTITEEDGDLMVARLRHLRRVIDSHADALDETNQHEVADTAQKPEGRDTTIIPFRRRVPRRPAGWPGVCRFDGSDSERRACRVVDISMLGLGLVLEHPAFSGPVGLRVSVEVSAVDDRVNIRLEGIVRHATVTPEGDVRMGVEFDDSGDTESSCITSDSNNGRR